MKRLFLTLLLASVITPTFAFKQAQVDKVAPPDGEVYMLRGYDSRTGGLMNVCLKPVKKSRVTSESTNPDGFQKFEYVNHAQQMMEEQNLGVAAKVKVNFGVGSASASTDMEFYQKNSSSVQQGAMWAYYSDLEAPEYSNPAAQYELTEGALDLFKRAVKKGGSKRAFEKHCGDSVVIGLQSGRHAEGILTNRSESKESQKRQKLKVEAAASYMGSKASVSVEKSGETFTKSDFNELKVEFRTSGDVEIAGISDMNSFRKAFRQFQKQPKEDARTLKFIYLISYNDLLPKSAFDLGLPAKQMRKVNRIINGITTIESAYITAKNDAKIRKNPTNLRKARKTLKKEYQIASAKIRQEKGCLGKWTKTCENLYQRFNNFNKIGNMQRQRDFVRNAYQSNDECSTGYPLSKPNGQRICKVCDIAKEPRFINRENGRCGYIANDKRKKKTTRLWAHDLKIADHEFGGGGEYLKSRLTYPDKCKKKGKGCGKPAATQLCEVRGFEKAVGFEVWGWRPSNPIHRNQFITKYANDKTCKADPSAFTPVKCRTFKYIDCAGGTGTESAKKNNKKGKKKGKNKGKKGKEKQSTG